LGIDEIWEENFIVSKLKIESHREIFYWIETIRQKNFLEAADEITGKGKTE